MTDRDEAARAEILARLAVSREELRRVLAPPRKEPNANGSSIGDAHPHGEFPRSRTMQMLMSGRGIGAVGAVAGGLLMARPALAWRLIRMLPTSAVARVVVGRVMGSLRGKSKD